MNISSLLKDIIENIFKKLNLATKKNIKLKKSIYSKFGDYQLNITDSILKNDNVKYKKLAKIIKEELKYKKEINKVDISYYGYINIFLNPNWVSEQLDKILNSSRLYVHKTKSPKKIAIDYSAPNIAKEMHIGHLRSTIIGDAMVRILQFLGHKVIRCNHIGDWGTNFGILIAYFKYKKNINNINKIKLRDLEIIYSKSKKHYYENKKFAEKSRKYVVELQSGDKSCYKIWQKLIKITMEENKKIYKMLNVTLKEKDTMGESIYNKFLPKIIEDLKVKGLVTQYKGANVIILDNFKNKLGEKMGVVIQKSDGAYLYSTTDIASIKYRFEKFKVEKIIYYVDFRQKQHLQQVFQIVRLAKYIPKSLQLEHHYFGMILDENKKPFKTRSGNTIKLIDLLNESIKKANFIIKKNNPNIDKKELNKYANILGIGAIKYADLSKNRIKNYIFNWNEMLNFEGNTILYIQYAYVRTISILNNIKIKEINKNKTLSLKSEQEIKLGICLLQLEEILYQTTNNGMPHILCNYLYELSNFFSSFYETCEILKNKNNDKKITRIKLVLITSKTIKKGLNLLGIKVLDKM